MAVKEETRKLVAHEKLLIDVIKKQAGSLKKAILEGTMNSVEAGATEIDIKFRAERTGPAFLSIYDDGIGILIKALVAALVTAIADSTPFRMTTSIVLCCSLEKDKPPSPAVRLDFYLLFRAQETYDSVI